MLFLDFNYFTANTQASWRLCLSANEPNTLKQGIKYHRMRGALLRKRNKSKHWRSNLKIFNWTNIFGGEGCLAIEKQS